MVSYVTFITAKTPAELTQTINRVLEHPETQVSGFTYNPKTEQYECLVQYSDGHIPNKDAVLQQLSLPEQKEYERNTALELLKMYNGHPDKLMQVAKEMGLPVDKLDDLLRGSA